MEGRTVYATKQMWARFEQKIPGKFKIPGKAMLWLIDQFNKGKIDRSGLEEYIIGKKAAAKLVHGTILKKYRINRPKQA